MSPVSICGGARCGALCAILIAGVCMAQAPAQSGNHGSCTMTDENGKTISLPECETTNTTPRPETPQSKSAAQRFPYPGETPDSGQSAGGKDDGTPASKRFPYPGEAPASSAQPTDGNNAPLKDAGSSGDSSSSSSSSSSADDAMKDLGPDSGEENPYKADDDAARARAAARRSKREAPPPPPKSKEDQEAEDVEVAQFYQNGGNYRGAYVRAKEAISLSADDPDAHLALADAARKLGKMDEADAEYKACLKLDPVPKTKKAAEKALKEMSGGR